MNYVHNSVMFLIGAFKSVVQWLFTVELVSYENVSISFGETFLYFFIVYLVISLLLNARFSNIGQVHKENVRKEREQIKEDNKRLALSGKARFKKTNEYASQRADNYFANSYDYRKG